jgi:hypothetical protein
MKKFLIAITLLSVIASMVFSAPLSIEYQMQQNYHRLKVLLNGDIRWNVSQTDNTYEITLMGDESYFVMKNTRCSFLHGIIKSFNYRTTLPGTKKMSIELRAGVNDYNIYQNDITKELFIEFYPGRWVEESGTKSIAAKKPILKEQTTVPQPKQTVVNIPQIVLDQVEQQPKKEVEVRIPSAPVQQQQTSSTSSAALWLILFSISILLTGGGLTVYAFIRRRASRLPLPSRRTDDNTPMSPGFTIVRHDAGPIVSSISKPVISEIEQDAPDMSYARGLSEQYYRSQGELELQEALEKMSARSVQKKVEDVSPSSRKKDPAALAQKLGLSVGELELVTRLQEFHKKHSAEVS